MRNTKLAYRYAKSLLDLAKEAGKLEKVLSDIQLFNKTLDNRDMLLMLRSPIVKSDIKQKVIELLFKGRTEDMTLAFYKIVINKKREQYLEDIAEAFIDLYNKENGIVTAQLTTATPVSDAIKKEIEKNITKTSNAKNVDLSLNEDKSIIGGFKLMFEDKLYDASVSSQLATLRKEFLN